MNCSDLTTYFYFMGRFIAAHEGISQWFALGCVTSIYHRTGRIEVVLHVQTSVFI